MQNHIKKNEHNPYALERFNSELFNSACTHAGNAGNAVNAGTGVLFGFGGSGGGNDSAELARLVARLTSEVRQLREANTAIELRSEELQEENTHLARRFDDVQEQNTALALTCSDTTYTRDAEAWQGKFPIVSIAGATHITKGDLDSARVSYNILPQQFVNGDYMRTCEHRNGQPVYVKMCGAQVSAMERVCIWISPTKLGWWVGKARDCGHGRGYALIRTIKENTWMELHALVKLHETLEAKGQKAVQVDVSGRVHEGQKMLRVCHTRTLGVCAPAPLCRHS